MHFPSILRKQINANKHYLGLFLKNEEAIGFVFEINKGSIEIVAQHSCPFSNGWNTIVEDIDNLIFTLESETKTQLNEAILFVYSYFIDEKTKVIKKPYKDYVKKLLKQLELKPLGFIECYEAVAAYLEEKHKSLLNAVLVELDTDHIGVFIYKGGHKTYANDTLRTGDITDDIKELLRGQQGEMLPPKIIIYDSEDAAKQAHSLGSYHWGESLFMQHPKIEVIHEKELYQALGNIFFGQIYQNDVHEDRASSELETTNSEQQATHDEQLTVNAVPETVEQAPMGFVIGKDIDEVAEEVKDQKPKSKKSLSLVKLPKFSFLGKNLLKGRKNPLFIVAGILLIILVLFLVEYQFHTAALTVYFPSEPLQKDLDFTIPIGGEDKGLEIKTGTLSAQLSDKVKTTGKKSVGESAKGTVTIRNFDSQPRVFTQGTTLSANGHSFTLDSDVNVASASVSLVNGDYVKQPGKNNGNITAVDIGPESNLDKGTKFSISGLSSDTYFAMNDNPLTGGTKKDIQTVAKKDLEDVKNAILTKGKEQGLQDLQSKEQSGQEQIFNDLTEVNLSDSHYSKELGEEATELSLTATVNTIYYGYDDKELKSILADQLQSDVPSGMELAKDKITYAFKKVTKKNDDVNISLNAEGSAVKKVPVETLKKAVVGQSTGDLDQILRLKNGAASYEVKKINSPLFIFGSRMPFFEKNIIVNVSSK